MNTNGFHIGKSLLNGNDDIGNETEEEFEDEEHGGSWDALKLQSTIWR